MWLVCSSNSLARLERIDPKKIYIDKAGKLLYNKTNTANLIKNIRKKGGGKGRKYKIYTGPRGGKYYKRKGKKIYI